MMEKYNNKRIKYGKVKGYMTMARDEGIFMNEVLLLFILGSKNGTKIPDSRYLDNDCCQRSTLTELDLSVE